MKEYYIKALRYTTGNASDKWGGENAAYKLQLLVAVR